MKKQYSSLLKWQSFWICTLMAGNMLAQNAGLNLNRSDSIDRYGAIGIRPGVFMNLHNSNEFNMPLLGIYIDYSFGNFKHTIDLDFLVRKPRKIFKHSYSPCFTYTVAYKTTAWKKIDVHSGVFINCRKDVLTKEQYFFPNDTTLSYATSGFHTVFSLGPSLEMSRKIFFPGKRSFLIIGAKIMYSFDILAYGITFNAAKSSSVDPWERVPIDDRFQRDAFVASLKIGWGKLAGEKSESVDYELDFLN